MKKVTDTVRKLLLALILALALLNVTSCDMLGNLSPTPTTPTQPTNPDDNNPTNPTVPGDKTHYSDYENFNPADYPILNESGKPDSAIADLKDLIWLCYAEREDIGEWTANYIKSNKIKTILSNDQGANAWIDPDKLDRIYLNEDLHSMIFGWYNDSQYNDNDRANMRENMSQYPSHETMHLVQYKSGAFNLMKGMRPDICAAVNMLTEYLAWFYTEIRDPGTDMTIDMKDAVERQSEYMILSTDPWNDPNRIHVTPWFNNELSTYARQAFQIGIVRENAMIPPLRQASKEDMMKVACAMLACRDPNKAGVTDEALWTVFDALCKAAVGNSKYLHVGTVLLPQELFDDFQDFIAEWDAAFAAQ
jgi:hypothetical protein